MVQVFIIVMNKANSKQIWKDKSKHVNFDERGSQDMLQSNHSQLFTLLGILVEPSTTIETKLYLEESPSSR